MPYLGDYIGHLLSEITIARTQADLEAVRLAEMYASHPLLRHLPVPRVRLPTMTLDAPVVIKKMEEAPPGEPARGGVVLPAMRESFGRLLSVHLERAQIKLPAAARKSVDAALDQAMAKFSTPSSGTVSVLAVADDLVAAIAKTLGPSERGPGPVEPAVLEKLAGELKEAARQEFVSLRKAPPRLLVQVTTAELRDAGPADLLARVHLSVSENAVEWMVTESQGKTQNRLVPE